jgi:hypothetical protein
MKIKTTFKIDDSVIARLKKEASLTGCTMSELAENAIRLMLETERRPRKFPPLPTFRSGGALVDIADRDALAKL